MADKVKVGIIGCGNILGQYVKGCRYFQVLDLVACADIDMEKANAAAKEHNIRALTVDQLLAEPDIEIVINLTIPAVHAEVDLKIIAAGKHVYSEKPFSISRAEGEKVMEAAEKAGVKIGCAPDTFLGGGIQTVRKIIDDGWIGEPVAATAFMLSHGVESWHPNPDFFYKTGGGPMFDMGPYYITALVNLLGPVRRVTASTRTSFKERIATTEANFGRRISVEVPTHYSGSLDFASGAIATVVMSFDVWRANVPRIEIFGSEGSISVPDPNTFVGPVKVWTAKDGEWRDVPLTHSAKVGRGIGVADMAYSLQKKSRAHRASGELAFHVLDVMQSFGEASNGGRAVKVKSKVKRPAALPTGLLEGLLDA